MNEYGIIIGGIGDKKLDLNTKIMAGALSSAKNVIGTEGISSKEYDELIKGHKNEFEKAVKGSIEKHIIRVLDIDNKLIVILCGAYEKDVGTEELTRIVKKFQDTLRMNKKLREILKSNMNKGYVDEEEEMEKILKEVIT